MLNVLQSNPQPNGHGKVEVMLPAIREVLIKLGSAVTLETGTELFRQGDSATALFLLYTGALEVSVLSEDGRKLTLNFLQKGTIFGEIALFDGGSRSATVTAAERSEVLKIDRGTFLNEIRSNPDFAVDMLRLCFDRLRWVTGQLENHVFHPLPVRLARRLIYLLDARGQGNVLPMSQTALAEHVGVTREAVAKVLSEWKAAGIVTPGRGQITIRDRGALQTCAHAGQV